MGFFSNAWDKVKGFASDRWGNIKDAGSTVIDTGKTVGKFIGKTASDVYHDGKDIVTNIAGTPERILSKFGTPFLVIAGAVVVGVAIWALKNDVPNRVLKSKGI